MAAVIALDEKRMTLFVTHRCEEMSEGGNIYEKY